MSPDSALIQSLAAALPLPGDALRVLARGFTARQVGKGQALLHRGEPWRQALWIERGALRMYFSRRDGREFNKNFFLEGALLCPLTPAMWAEPSLFEIAAVESGRVWCAEATTWRERLSALNQWEPLRLELLTRLLNHKRQREHDLLTLDARRRYAAFSAREPRLAQRIPLLHLASYLGMTDVTLSRIRHDAVRGQ